MVVATLQHSRPFWASLLSSHLQDVNGHRGRAGRPAKRSTVVAFGLACCPHVSKVSEAQGSGGPWSRSAAIFGLILACVISNDQYPIPACTIF